MAAGVTNTTTAAPCVLAVGCPAALVERCTRVLVNLGAMLRVCSVAEATTVAAERQPLAILIPEDLYEFDPDAFTALARDVRATLVKVEPDIEDAALEARLTVAIARTLSRRDGRTSTGRYAIIGSPAVDVVPAVRAAADGPPSTERGGSLNAR